MLEFRPGTARSIVAMLIFVAMAAGCGGGTEPTTPPPPPPPPSAVPASVSVAAGDGQEGEPGAIVGAVSVLVRTAAGAPVPNVAVAFSVDSGGGSVATPNATTDATGIASAGRWTLGVEGPQVVGVTVANLPTVKIRATARLAGTTATLPTIGGKVTLTRPGSPLNGLTITVPTGTYSTPTEWSISELTSVHPTLPPKVRQIGSAIQISNGQGFANKPFSIVIPVRVGADSTVNAFFRDPISGAMELIPIVARTDSSLVLMTQHVAADQMLLPDQASSIAGAAAAAAAPGAVEIIIVGGRTIDLQVRINTSFRPGVDDWEFTNYGSFLAPGGFCAGSTLSAIYHNYARKPAKGALFGLYDSLPTVDEDNPRGLRLASVAQNSMEWDDGELFTQYAEQLANPVFVQLGGAAWVQTQMEALAMAMLVTGKGQQLAIYKPTFRKGHAIIAHGMQWGTMYVTDPNHPGQERTIQFTNEQFIPFSFASSARLGESLYQQVFVLSASALVPVRKMDALFRQLDAGTIGNGLFREIVNEYRDPVDSVWRKAEGTIVTASAGLTLRTMCAACRDRLDRNLSDPKRGVLALVDEGGHRLGDDLPDEKEGVEIETTEGAVGLGFATFTLPDDSTNSYLFHTFNWIQVKKVDFEIEMDPAKPVAGQPIKFTIVNGGIGNSSAKYRWYFGDEDPIETSFSEKSLTRTYADPIGVIVTVELRDAKGVLARTSLEIGTSNWRIITIEDQDGLLGDEIDGSGPIKELLDRLMAAPRAGLISVDDVAGRGTELRLRARKSGVWFAEDCCPVPAYNPATEMLVKLGVDPAVPHQVGPFFAGWNRDYWSQTTGDLGSGDMKGQYLFGTKTYAIKDGGSQIGPTGGVRITATRSGIRLDGVISFFIWFVDDESGEIEQQPDEFRFPFTAVRMR